MNAIVGLFPSDSPVIGNGGVDEATARDITADLVAKVAAHPAVYIEPGYYKMDPDQVAWVEADGPKIIKGAGSYATFIGVTAPVGMNPGHAISMGSKGSCVGGFRMTDESGTPSKVSTGIYMHSERWQRVEDFRSWGLDAGIHLHGNECYYWDLLYCQCQTGNAGLRTTDDVSAEGPNRGNAYGLLMEGNAIDYDLQGGNTMSLHGCSSANGGTGIKSQVNKLRWIGGNFETYSGNAIEILAGASDNQFIGFTKAGVDTISDAGAGSIIMPADGNWTRDNATIADLAPDSAGSGSVAYKSQLASDTDLKRYFRRRSGARSWGDGATLKAHLELSGDDLRAKYRLRCEQFISEQQAVTPTAGTITPNVSVGNGQELVVDALTAVLTINNPVGWPDGLDVRVYLEADINGPYNLTWGSQYNGCPSVIDARKAIWVTLKRRNASKIDCIGASVLTA